MTRIDYDQIAEVIAGEVALCRTTTVDVATARRGLLRNLTSSIADVMARGNRNFDRERFYEACGQRGWRP